LSFLKKYALPLAGIAAGAVNGLFGAGGGMILVPLLNQSGELEEWEIFPGSICIILPICLVSLIFTGLRQGLPLWESVPYLAGSLAGGILAGLLGNKIPTLWLHRALGALILWGGIRNLC
jgi:uncharacterized membrane protein YfcA